MSISEEYGACKFIVKQTFGKCCRDVVVFVRCFIVHIVIFKFLKFYIVHCKYVYTDTYRVNICVREMYICLCIYLRI